MEFQAKTNKVGDSLTITIKSEIVKQMNIKPDEIITVNIESTGKKKGKSTNRLTAKQRDLLTMLDVVKMAIPADNLIGKMFKDKRERDTALFELNRRELIRIYSSENETFIVKVEDV